MSIDRFQERSVPTQNPPPGFHDVFVGTDGNLKKLDEDGNIVNYQDPTAVANAAVAAHVALPDPHTQYTTDAEATTIANTQSAAAIVTHVAQPDPHPQYAEASELAAHVGDTANPHATTKAQVGLGNADNTSDADKPISTATATALGLKADKATEIQTAATSGLQGGGDLSATRSLSLNINGLTPIPFGEKPPADAEVVFFDPGAPGHRKTTRQQMNVLQSDLYSTQYSDFIETPTGGLTASIAGTAASSQAGTYGLDNAENAKGVVQIDTGTTAAGRAGIGSALGTQMFVQLTDFYRLRMRCALEVLSTAIETFSYYPCAFTNNTAANGFGNQFVGFFYRYDENGGRYQFVVYSGGVLQTSIDTGVLADIDYKVFEITIDGATGEAKGYIDGVLVATVSAGVPAGPGQPFGFTTKIEKTVGLLQRNADIDWYAFEYFRNAAR